MIHQMSRQITRSLVNNDIIDFDEVTIYQYGLEVMLITIFQIIGIMLFAFFTGYVAEAIVFIMAFSSLRMYAGGYHASSVLRCLTLIIVFVMIDIAICKMLMLDKLPWISILISLISFLIVYAHAPVSVITRPITEKERIRFRKISINISFFYLIVITVLASANQYSWYLGIFSLGLLLEALSLLFEKYRKEIGR